MVIVRPKTLRKLKDKLSPKYRDPPPAMLDKAGNLVTSNDGTQERAIDTYKKWFKNKVMS